MNDDFDWRKYYDAGIRAAWQSLDPHENGACYRAWEAALGGWDHEQQHADRVWTDSALIEFAWGWRWATDRFEDNWKGVAPDARGVDMSVLWR